MIQGILGFGWALCLFIAVGVMPHSAYALSGPTMLLPKGNTTVYENRPVIAGLAPSGSAVRIYLDGQLIGKPIATVHSSGTGSFKFKPAKVFSEGSHTLTGSTERAGEWGYGTQELPITVLTKMPRNLDGVTVQAQNARAVPVGVMIENHPAARPQSGLRDASVVYETLAEGGITRLLAIFGKGTLAPRVGPVRSARPYYLSWASEYGAQVLHAGGSPDAQKEFGALKLRSIDALVSRTARYFFREGRRGDVHSLHTTSSLIDRARSDYGQGNAVAMFRSWIFKNDPPLDARPQKGVRAVVDFGSGAAYMVEWKYDRARNAFLRWNGGAPHRDRTTKGQIAAKNVLILLVPKERVLDKKGRLAIEVRGKGKGILLQDGKAITILWNKKDTKGRTIITALDGREVSFDRGPTWIEVLPQGARRSAKIY